MSEDPTMQSGSRIPQLAYPFALVGAAAGWLSAGFLANPLVELAADGQQPQSAACASVIAAVVGAGLTRWCVKRLVWHAPGAVWVRLVPAVLASGFVTGASVGYLGYPNAVAALSGGLNGFLSAIAFLPVCVMVVSAARRAERARLGSIVAGSDRRAVWGILAAALAMATLLALPDWPASRAGSVPVPLPALAMALAAGLVTLVVLLADAVALARVRRAAAVPGLERRDEGEIAPGDAPSRMDLGLGDGLLANLSRSAAAYRGRDRALSLLVGSPDQARSALRRALARGVAGLAIVGVVLGAHALAAGPRVTRSYHEDRCERGLVSQCRLAADLLRAERGSDGSRVVELYRRSCELTEAAGCAALADILANGEGVPADPALASSFRVRACDAGSVEGCRAAVKALRDAHVEPSRIVSLLFRACDKGDQASCAELTPEDRARFRPGK